ncbi:hypothetical protein Zmor_013495 [Zophobas morio]|uniref:Uncharacterized protein n=1 Tax=Zophobas morio TaxID=2755281 RepID=A0AA38IIP2_9CUCU|nr:hypothetical protein Zmor_013495 [Zophobas morio]
MERERDKNYNTRLLNVEGTFFTSEGQYNIGQRPPLRSTPGESRNSRKCPTCAFSVTSLISSQPSNYASTDRLRNGKTKKVHITTTHIQIRLPVLPTMGVAAVQQSHSSGC